MSIEIEVRELYPAPTHAAEIRHNALRLKALEQAMDEYGGQKTPDCYIDKYWIQCLKKRADEIMREWTEGVG